MHGSELPFASHRLHDGGNGATHEVQKRGFVCDVCQTRHTAVLARFQPSQNCHQRALGYVLSGRRVQTLGRETTLGEFREIVDIRL